MPFDNDPNTPTRPTNLREDAPTQSSVEFSLPDDLGWKCNDEISDYIDKWSENLYKNAKVHKQIHSSSYALWQVAKAELMDNIYSIIKRYL